MNGTFVRKLLFLFFTGVLSNLQLYSQENLSPEDEFLRIRSIAVDGDLVTAAAKARILVKSNPEYGDARILLARIFAWQKNYDAALAALDTLRLSEPQNADAISLRNDILKWTKTPVNSLTDLVGAYSFDNFNEPYSRFWQLIKTGVRHKFNWGPGALSLNTGHIKTIGSSVTRATEVQIEAEAYPKISPKNYAFLSYAYSPGNYFPGHRAAGEMWQVLPRGWTVSAGLNYYYFDRNIFIAGLSGEKYLGKYWLSVKGFIYFKDGGPTTSGYFNARRYLNDDNYLQVTLGTGTAPDESFDIQADLMRLSATSLRLAWYTKFVNGITLRIGTGFSVEEYAESGWRNRFEGNISVSFPIMKK